MYAARAPNLASAGTVNLSALAGNMVHITGTTTITAFTMSDGQQVVLVFDGALVLTNSATLVLPGAANITTAAGDIMIVAGDTTVASGVRCINYARAAAPATSFGPTTTVAVANAVVLAIDVNTVMTTTAALTAGRKYWFQGSLVIQPSNGTYAFAELVDFAGTPIPFTTAGAMLGAINYSTIYINTIVSSLAVSGTVTLQAFSHINTSLTSSQGWLSVTPIY
jgi:hypothetical protein